MARKSLLLLLAAVLILPLSAGGSAEADDGTVVIWHSNSGVIGNAFDDIVERFNSTIGAEKGITIEAIYQGSANDVLTKVKAAAAVSTSTLPDIAQLDATAALDMKNSDYLILPSDLGIDTSSIMPSSTSSPWFSASSISCTLSEIQSGAFTSNSSPPSQPVKVGSPKATRPQANNNLLRCLIIFI